MVMVIVSLCYDGLVSKMGTKSFTETLTNHNKSNNILGSNRDPWTSDGRTAGDQGAPFGGCSGNFSLLHHLREVKVSENWRLKFLKKFLEKFVKKFSHRCILFGTLPISTPISTESQNPTALQQDFRPKVRWMSKSQPVSDSWCLWWPCHRSAHGQTCP